MRRFLIAIVAAVTLAACGQSATAPVRVDAELDELFQQLEQAADASIATSVEQAIWNHWADSGSPTVNILLERATAAEAAGDRDLASSYLDQAATLRPISLSLGTAAPTSPIALRIIRAPFPRSKKHFAVSRATSRPTQHLA
jgi:hypothetical protein